MEAWTGSQDRGSVAAISTAADLVVTASNVLTHELERSTLDPHLARRMETLLREAQWLASDLAGLAEVADAVEFAATG